MHLFKTKRIKPGTLAACLALFGAGLFVGGLNNESALKKA